MRSITTVQPVHVAGYIEELTRERSAPTAKQRLAAIRHLFDWLVVGQVMPVNPASSVRGPSHVVKRGKRRCCRPRRLDAIDVSTHAGLRDRALIGLMVFFVCAHRRGARDEGRGRVRAEPNGRAIVDHVSLRTRARCGRGTSGEDRRLYTPGPARREF